MATATATRPGRSPAEFGEHRHDALEQLSPALLGAFVDALEHRKRIENRRAFQG
jgi:hypothetical protein